MNALLALLILRFGNELAENTRQYQDGKKTKDEWRAEFLRLLALYLSAALMLGLDKSELDAAQEQIVAVAVLKQQSYLDGFAQDIDGLTQEQAIARTQLYASSATELYWQGKTWGLHLPAYPGDGSAECLQFDKCQWELHWLDKTNGNVDAYWVMNPDAEHCPTCIDRANHWSPLRIRNWQY